MVSATTRRFHAILHGNACKVAVMLAVWMALSTGMAMAREPDPMVRIPLAPMGYQSMAQDFLLAGSTMLTVDFVDKDHLLVTFGVRRLMVREVDPPPNDDDRTVGAVLVELPSGKVLARTEWRTHDRLQYLWSLGHGRFLLRVRDQVSVIAPMQAASPEDAFREGPLLQIDRHIVAILVSPEGDLLTVETTKKVEVGDEAADIAKAAEIGPVRSSFYRLTTSGPSQELRVLSAGTIQTRRAVLLPMTAAGYLEVLESNKGTYLFNFDEHAGKVEELPAFDSSCFPLATFVGRAEFVVFGCRGSDRQKFAGFNLKGDQMWQQNFFESYVSPTFSYAPAAGRFALGRTLVSAPFDPQTTLSASAVTAQEVRVYQTYNGKQVFRMDCSPVERSGQNFSLSDDGLRLAVIRETMVQHKATKDEGAYVERTAAVEVYALPALSSKDQAAVKDAQAAAPTDTGARIDQALARAMASNSVAAAKASEAARETAAPDQNAAGQTLDAGQQAAPVADKTSLGAPEPSRSAGEAAGDTPLDAPRTPPTLYGPDEKPGGKTPK